MPRTSNKIIYRVLDNAELTSYELELLGQGKIRQALPLHFWRDKESKYIELSLPQKALTLVEKDGKGPLSQGLGLSRCLEIIDTFLDLKQRLLRPSFIYLNLDLIFVTANGLQFPVLPLGENQAARLPDNKIYPDFWSEWAGFYGVQIELAELGRKLSEQGNLLKLREIYRSYLRKEQNFTRLGFKASLREAWGRYDPIAPARALAMNVTESCLAELLPVQEGRFLKERKRLALLTADEFILGRDPIYSNLSFNDPWMGRRHARILRESGHYYIEDLASLNGTYVDGRKLLRFESLLLPQNCLIKMGKSLVEFRQLEQRNYFVPNNLSPASPRPGTI